MCRSVLRKHQTTAHSVSLTFFLSAFCTQTLLSLWLSADFFEMVGGVFLGANSVNDRLSVPCAQCHPPACRDRESERDSKRAVKLQLLLPSGLHMGSV